MRVNNHTGRVIDYDKLLNNVEEMITLLEYDSMRSAGKCKLNGVDLNNLYQLKDRYTEKLAAAPKKSAPKKVAEEAAD